MNNIVKGVIAGFEATVILSILMAMKLAMGLMPELNTISILSGMMHSGPAMSWIAHFMISAVICGGLFALLAPKLPGGRLWLKGVVFGIGALCGFDPKKMLIAATEVIDDFQRMGAIDIIQRV